MMILTHVDKDGNTDGYWLSSPPAPKSIVRSPAGFFKIAGTITGDTLRFSNLDGSISYKHTLTSANRMNYIYTLSHGPTGHTVLDPVWTLVEAERLAKR